MAARFLRSNNQVPGDAEAISGAQPKSRRKEKRGRAESTDRNVVGYQFITELFIVSRRERPLVLCDTAFARFSSLGHTQQTIIKWRSSQNSTNKPSNIRVLFQS
ncbi:hypothetical protein JTE90_013986 [Oedothorax gibbosus]|uniref:Uncharacterized protein n=1 Tax=Oedothorax gibbosus TaxID=931172 RepID=A0AAV6UFM9_9ARAC|nr:hypothetical protein JTE90_013986 [Oedothorax gibbosus]